MAEKDITEKTLISLNDVFADVVNGLLFHGEQLLKEDMLEDVPVISSYKDGQKIRSQERDVAKFWIDHKDERVKVRIAFLGIENQTAYDRDMVFRILNYDAAAYRVEPEQSDRYPVITLVLYFGDKPWGKVRSLYDAIRVPDKLQPYVNDYHINVFEIAHLPEESIEWFHSDFKIVVDYFLHRRKDPDYRPRNDAVFRHVDELLNMMAAITNDDRYVDVLDTEERRPKNMDEYLDRLLAKGEAKGREEGREEGRMEGEISTLASLVKKGLLSLTSAAKEMDLTPEEFQKKVAELTAIRY